jgi:hypothetical protein
LIPAGISSIMAYQTCHFYNLEAAVGLDCPNRYSDVLIVELLLGCFARINSIDGWRQFATTVPGFANVKAYPSYTGRYSKDLQAWIDLFLAFNQRVKDGRIDPMKDHHGDITVRRGDQYSSLYQLCNTAMQQDIAEYFAIGARAGLKISWGANGIFASRSQI